MENEATFWEKRRVALGLSQRAVAAKLEISNTTVNSWESRSLVPHLRIAAKLAVAYEVSQEQIEAEIVKLTRELSAASA